MRAIIILAVLAMSGCANQTQRASANRPPNPAIGCVEGIASRSDLAPIAKKIWLGDVRLQPFTMLTLTDKVTEGDKPLLAAWVNARQECSNQGQLWLQQYAPPQIVALVNNFNSDALALAADLYEGKVTYGDYAKTRAKKYADLQRDAAAVVQHGQEQQAAADEQNRNRALTYLLNQPAFQPAPVQVYQPPRPINTNCYRFGNQVNCTSY